MADVRDTPIQTAATMLPPVALCGVLGGSYFSFFFFGPLKKRLGITDAKMMWKGNKLAEVPFAKPIILCQSLITSCEKCLKLQGDCMEK